MHIKNNAYIHKKYTETNKESNINMTNLNDLKNIKISNYYKYLCLLSNKYYNAQTDSQKHRKNYGNLFLLQSINQIIEDKDIPNKILKEILPITIKQFNLAFYTEGLFIKRNILKQILLILKKYQK
jgi:hypothetical protein